MNPDADEICDDGIDNDCDGDTDADDTDCMNDDDDTSGDDDDDASDDDDDTTTLNGGMVSLVRHEYLYPEVYTPPPTSQVWAVAYFYTPVEMDAYQEIIWNGNLPAVDACVTYDAAAGSGLTLNLLAAGTSVDLQGPTNLTLPNLGDYYSVDSLALGQHQPGTYGLDIMGGADVVAQSIPNALVAPPSFTVTPEMAPGAITTSSLASGLTFQIQGSCPMPVVNLDIFEEGGTYVESVLCHFAGGPDLSIPGSYTNPYTGAIAVIPTVECYQKTETSLAGGSSLTGIGRVIVSGVLYVQ